MSNDRRESETNLAVLSVLTVRDLVEAIFQAHSLESLQSHLRLRLIELLQLRQEPTAAELRRSRDQLLK